MTKVAVVGAGYWGPNLIRNFVAKRACSELWVCERDEARLERIKERYPSVRATTSFDEVLNSDVDGVVIATAVGSHYPLATQALEVGKHVFVEKPLAASVEQAQSLVDQAERSDRRLMVGHTFEYSPPVMKLGELIRGDVLGRIFFISSNRVNLGLHQKDISVVWDLAPHDFSILFYWLDDRPVTISAMGRDFVQEGIPDVAFISVEFSSGTLAHLEVSWLSPSKLRRTTIVGAKKMAVYDDTEAFEKVKIFDRGVDYKDPETFGEFQLSYRTGDIVSPRLDSFEPLSVEADEFLSAISEGRRPRSDGRSGLRVVEALAAAERSLLEGGRPIRL